ncbi:thyroxine 5-deiodinase-like [Hydractinia symbiolongicarpus]|uniref:thyroxine 5-deiodinase-like n=1 Tax=Hydractinia symbiolongicarpus TaxID=13093 RepID=UPI00254E585E|nr:thyroxine 5-deiodinase-like [Hydractinia symbiolongicarpus]
MIVYHGVDLTIYVRRRFERSFSHHFSSSHFPSFLIIREILFSSFLIIPMMREGSLETSPNNQIFINAHKTIDERVSAANQLKSHYPDVPVYIDPLDNTISRSFGAYPERLYILLDNVILYDGNVGPFFYSLSAVEDWIVNYVEKQ